ncbi:MAG: zinc-dependent peptidase [Rubrivivax sp.]|nr:zinc-dependent peptidase [Rubrivivax sp.]
MTFLPASWRDAWRARQERAALARRAIPDKLWRRTLKRFAFLPQEGPREQLLRRLSSLFLDRKEFTGAHGLQITDDMVVAIAAQACLPVLQLGLQAYDGFVGIVVHPGQARVRRERMDEHGIVHEDEEILAGEAVDGGPVMLSWRDVRASGASAAEGYNVVIHEFAHVLDMTDGLANGRPLLPAGLSAQAWDTLMLAEYEAFCLRVDAEEATGLDPYGAQALEEFFAVASEAYFVQPEVLAQEHPQLLALLGRYYEPAGQNRD